MGTLALRRPAPVRARLRLDGADPARRSRHRRDPEARLGAGLPLRAAGPGERQLRRLDQVPALEALLALPPRPRDGDDAAPAEPPGPRAIRRVGHGRRHGLLRREPARPLRRTRLALALSRRRADTPARASRRP